MNTLAIQREVASLLVPLGVAGAAIAVASVLLACIILVVRGEEIGLPVAGWIIGTLLSLAAAFTDLAPTIVAVSAGVALAAFALAALGLKRSRMRRMLSGARPVARRASRAPRSRA